MDSMERIQPKQSEVTSQQSKITSRQETSVEETIKLLHHPTCPECKSENSIVIFEEFYEGYLKIPDKPMMQDKWKRRSYKCLFCKHNWQEEI